MTKKASECKSLDEVRGEIDRIDKEIITLLGNRFDFVKEVVRYRNPDKPEVPDRNRFEQVIRQRGQWAAEQGLEAASIEKVYRELIEYYIREQAALAKELK